jgi:hypothetical protein
MADRLIKLLAVEWASNGLPGDGWTLSTPPDRVLSYDWLRGDPATRRIVVVIERDGCYETAVLVAREV